MEFLSTAEMILVAQQVAREYAGMFSWAQGLTQDLAQEGIVSILQAANGYVPELGEPRAWAAGCARRGAWRYLWRNRGVVGSTRPREELRHVRFYSLENTIEEGARSDRHATGRFHRAELDFIEQRERQTGILGSLLDEDTIARELPERVRERLVGHDPGGLGHAVALREMDPARVAAAVGVPVRDVYWARKNMTRRAAKDPALRELWEEVR